MTDQCPPAFRLKLRGNCPCILLPCHLSFVFSAMLSFIFLVSFCTSLFGHLVVCNTAESVLCWCVLTTCIIIIIIIIRGQKRLSTIARRSAPLQHASSPSIHVWYGRNKILIASDTPVFLKLLLLVSPPTPPDEFICVPPPPSFLDAVTYEKSYFISTLLVDISNNLY